MAQNVSFGPNTLSDQKCSPEPQLIFGVPEDPAKQKKGTLASPVEYCVVLGLLLKMSSEATMAALKPTNFVHEAY